MQNTFPPRHFFRVVKPVFRKRWENVVVYDQTKPLIRTFPAAAEIAVPDGESPPQGPVPQDLLVQLFYLGNQLIKLIAAQSALIPDKTVGVKCGLHFKKPNRRRSA